MVIELDGADLREGLRLERALARAHDLMHLAENDLNRYIAHLRAVYHLPEGYALRDWMIGFEPPADEQPQAQPAARSDRHNGTGNYGE